uniref:Uncharacterized protein n=1 Tax=Anguilla anguilla TaxID=7936 RepID=A0A0E9UY47_ANGAN
MLSVYRCLIVVMACIDVCRFSNHNIMFMTAFVRNQASTY